MAYQLQTKKMAAAAFPKKQLLSFPSQQTPIRKANVPTGHILASLKWKGTDIIKYLKELGPVQLSDSLGLIDFQISSQSAVVYLIEGDIICGDTYKNNIIKIKKANSSTTIVVVVEKTALTESYFPNIQHYVILEIGLKLVPVASAKKAAEFFHEMSIADSKANSNPFRNTKRPPINTFLVKFIQEIPGIDRAKAEKLLQRFSNIQKICNASKEELSSVVGVTLAQNLKTFISKSHKKT